MSLEKLVKGLGITLGVGFGILGFNRSLEARTLRVPSVEYLTIQSGVDAATDDDTVLVASGIYNEQLGIIDKSITLKSESGYDLTTIDGGSTGWTINIPPSLSNLMDVIEGFTIKGENGIAASPYQSTIRIENNKFKTISGAIGVGRGIVVILRNFIDNSGGPAIGVTNGTANIFYNVIIDNTNQVSTGGIELEPGVVYLSRNTLIGRSKIEIIGSGSLTYSNNVFYTLGNKPSQINSNTMYNEGCNDFFINGYLPNVVHPTDISTNPMFCDEVNNDFYLDSDSPCLPQNSNGCGLIGALGMGCGAVPTISKTWGRIKAMYK